MASIKILHASDLHIAHHKELRSPLDQLYDLENPWDMSGSGAVEKLIILRELIKAWWRRTSASSYDPQLLEALAEYIYAFARKRVSDEGEVTREGDDFLDAVVLTGDIATTGQEEDIQRAKYFLRGSYNPMYPHKSNETDYRGGTLSAVRIPVVYLPGNHDRYQPTKRFYSWKYPRFFNPGGTEFDDVLADYRVDRVQRAEVTSEDKALKVVIFTADFTLQDFDDHEGLFGWLAQGMAYSDIRKKLALKTEEEQHGRKENEVLCILWAIHFPPFYPGGKSHSKLLKEEKLIELANRLSVHAILAGHTHKQLNYENPAFAFKVLCCGTTTQHEPLAQAGQREGHNLLEGNHFQVITVTSDTSGRLDISTKHFRYSSVRRSASGEPDYMHWGPSPSL